MLFTMQQNYVAVQANFKTLFLTIMSGKYFPNRWKQIKNLPDENFEPVSFIDFMEFKHCCEGLRPGYNYLVRAQRKDTFEVTEHKYKMLSPFQKRVYDYLMDDEVELTVFTPELGTVILEGIDN